MLKKEQSLMKHSHQLLALQICSYEPLVIALAFVTGGMTQSGHCLVAQAHEGKVGYIYEGILKPSWDD